MKTRFAPSPTGDLHIGGARTALYNFLVAKHFGGEFVLRIEDTDKERNSAQSLISIFDGLEWLGLKHDGEVVYQSSQEEFHKSAVKDMLDKGSAYPCYTTQFQLDALRKISESQKQGFKYNRKWRDIDDNEDLLKELDACKTGGFEPSIRIKMPLDGVTEFDDIIRGKLSINNSELDDFVILRSDGTPTYLLAVVVDDHNAGITHVIRGEDHITNTFKQIQIYKALGWEPPKFAHIPLIHGEDGKKLSKRHGAVSVLEWRDAGYLPEAVCSYLVGLGWGHAVDNMSMRDMIEKFDINQVGSSPSRLDQKKLDKTNYYFLQQVDCSTVRKKIFDYQKDKIAVGGITTASKFKNLMLTMLKLHDDIITQLRERAKTFVELCKSAEFLFDMPVYDESACKILSTNIGIIQRFIPAMVAGDDFHKFAEDYGYPMKDVAITLRAALCGSKTSSGGMETIIKTLGDDEVLSRLQKAVDEFGGSPF